MEAAADPIPPQSDCTDVHEPGDDTSEVLNAHVVSEEGEEPIAETEDGEGETEETNFGHLDLRVVTVLALGMHPNPDDQVRYVEKIGIQTPKQFEYDDEDDINADPRSKILEETVESGVPHLYDLDMLVGLKTIALCNMKPVTTVRGLEMNIAVLCARNGDEFDFLEAPSNANIGDPVLVQGYTHNPRTPFINNFIKSFGDDLKVNDKQEVVYKGLPLKAGPKEEIIKTVSFKNCSVGNILNLKDI